MHINRIITSVAMAACVGAGCSANDGATSATDGGSGGGATLVDDAARTNVAVDASGALCVLCIDDSDCGGGACVQVGFDSYCAPACGAGASCDEGLSCAVEATVSGARVEVCLPATGPCAAPPAPDDAGRASDAGHASDAGAHDEDAGPSAKDAGKDGGDGITDASLGPSDAGPLPTGAVGPTGGKVSLLHFAVVGDTRPPIANDSKAYPTKIITQIYEDIAALSPMPPFVVSTGDYQFSTPKGTAGATQMGYYMTARGHYPGAWFPALGNHECTGATASNCGPGNADGVTDTYAAFLDLMLAPIDKALPYYSIRVDAIDGSWTSKFVFVAANAWDATQDAWLEATLSEPTTYTFLVRHEPSVANTAPGVKPAESIMAKHPYTLSLTGHAHLYARESQREIVIGNGGAPLNTVGSGYGYGLVTQRDDGAVTVQMIDYETGASDPKFEFAVNADGSSAK